DPRSKLTFPGILLIIVAIANILSSLFWILGFLSKYLGQGNQDILESGAYMIGYYIGATVPVAIAITSLVVAPVIIFGAIRMLSAKSYNIAKMAAVLTLLPLTSFCCLLGLPIGIWALLVLNKPEVKGIFSS